MKNELIELEVNKSITDEAGDTVIETTWREVFAEKKSIGTQEFYSAHSEGLKPVFKFIVHPTEYDWKTNGLHIRYENRVFKIIRTYEKDDEHLEITVEGDIHGNA